MTSCEAFGDHPQRIDVVVDGIIAHIELHSFTMCDRCKEQMLYSLIKNLAGRYGDLVFSIAKKAKPEERGNDMVD